jgi:hypothetical protein
VGRIASSPQLQVLLSDEPRATAHFPSPSSSPGGGSGGSARCHAHVLSGVEFGMGALNCLASKVVTIA